MEDYHVFGRLAPRYPTHKPLCVAEFAVLLVLVAYDDHGCRSEDIRENLGWGIARVSEHVSALVVRGMVRRSKDPTNRRKSVVQLTPKGQRMVESGIGFKKETK